jgi:hypothetical protein
MEKNTFTNFNIEPKGISAESYYNLFTFSVVPSAINKILSVDSKWC